MQKWLMIYLLVAIFSPVIDYYSQQSEKQVAFQSDKVKISHLKNFSLP